MEGSLQPNFPGESGRDDACPPASGIPVETFSRKMSPNRLIALMLTIVDASCCMIHSLVTKGFEFHPSCLPWGLSPRVQLIFSGSRFTLGLVDLRETGVPALGILYHSISFWNVCFTDTVSFCQNFGMSAMAILCHFYHSFGMPTFTDTVSFYHSYYVFTFTDIVSFYHSFDMFT